VAIEPIITPKINKVITSLTLSETKNRINKTIKDPKIAAIGIEIEETTEKPINEAPITSKATPKPAPELIPKIYGPASGFLNNVCINKPETERAKPHKIAVKAFGILDSKMIISELSGISLPEKASMKVEIGIETEPTRTSKMKKIGRLSSKMKRYIPVLFCLFIQPI
jgi:hypothetical protein